MIGTAKNKDEKEGPKMAEAFGMNYFKRNNFVPASFNKHEFSASPLLQRSAWNANATNSGGHQRLVFSDPFPNIMDSTHLVKDSIQPHHGLPLYRRDAPPVFSTHRPDTSNDTHFLPNQNYVVRNNPIHKYCFGEEGSDIQWNELVLKKKIGSGICRFFKLAQS